MSFARDFTVHLSSSVTIPPWVAALTYIPTSEYNSTIYASVVNKEKTIKSCEDFYIAKLKENDQLFLAGQLLFKLEECIGCHLQQLFYMFASNRSLSP